MTRYCWRPRRGAAGTRRRFRRGRRHGRSGAGAARPGIDLALVEIDPQLAELARDNAAVNGIAAEVSCSMSREPRTPSLPQALRPTASMRVLMNPPFNDPARHRASPDQRAQDRPCRDRGHAAELDSRRAADAQIRRHADADLAGGRIADVLAALGRGFGSLAIMPVHGDAKAPAIGCWCAPPRAVARPANSCRPDLRDESRRAQYRGPGDSGREGDFAVGDRLEMARSDAQQTSGKAYCGSVSDCRFGR